MKKYFFVSADIGEGIPSYQFVLNAPNIEEATREAFEIITRDYPEECTAKGGGGVYWEKDGIYDDFSVHELTAKEIIERLTIN